MMVNLSGISLELVRKDIKNLHLAVYPPDGRVRLSAPSDADEETLALFVASKVPWIRRKQRAMSELQRQSVREYLDRESHYFQGRRYLLRVHELSSSNQRARAKLTASKFLDLFVSDSASLEIKKRTLERFYRNELREVLQQLVPAWEKKLGVTATTWRIRPMKTKWGSCNPSKKSMLFNLELAKQPLDCIEYIVVHELAHLHEPKHNAKFEAILSQHLPNWRLTKQRMNDIPALEVGP